MQRALTLPTMRANPRGLPHRLQTLPVGEFVFREFGTLLGPWCAYQNPDLPLRGNQDSPTPLYPHVGSDIVQVPDYDYHLLSLDPIDSRGSNQWSCQRRVERS